jgi:hypothetical protein
VAAVAQAGDLDTAQQFYFKVRDLLGQNDFTQFDTTDEVRSAVNAGLRAVSVDIGIVGHDTVTIVANTFNYALQSNFMDKGLAHLPYKVFRITGDGTRIIGVSDLSSEQFSVSSAGTGQGFGPEVAGYSISGTRFWICPAAPPGDKLYIEGPINPTPHDSSTQVESVVPECDRWAVVYYAVELLARSRGNIALADKMQEKYMAHVAARQGDYRRGKGGQ